MVQLHLVTLEDKEEVRQIRVCLKLSQSDKSSDCENNLPPVYLEQFNSQTCRAQRQLVDLIVEIFTCEHAELIAKHLNTNPTLGPVLLCFPPPKQLEKTKQKHVIITKQTNLL